jgi:hypothetical protein
MTTEKRTTALLEAIDATLTFCAMMIFIGVVLIFAAVFS